MEKPTRDYSSKQEEHIAKVMGGKIQSNSGGTKFGGGDVHAGDFLIEAKTPISDKKSFSIKKPWIEKAMQQAYEQRKSHWSLAFSFEPGGSNYYIISEADMRRLVKLGETDENL